MTRPILDEAFIHAGIRDRISKWNHTIVDEVKAAVAANDVVVVGMTQNPWPAKARKALEAIGQQYKYLGYGSYLSVWKPRSALKMWTGWPTFPMVFVRGTLVGGYSDLKKLIDGGELKKMLA